MRFALFAALVCASSAAAQDDTVTNGSAIGNWIVQCNAVTVTQTACRVEQTLSTADTNQLVAKFIAVPRGADQTVLFAQVPMGVYLPAGAVFRIPDDAQDGQRQMVWQRCGNAICEAAIELSADDVVAFTAAGTIAFGYRMDPSVDPVILPLQVGQLGEAMAAIRVGN